MLETVFWYAGTARLLPRPLRDRTRGPVFVTHRRPGFLLMLMAKSRPRKPENVRRRFKSSPQAISELTNLLAPGDALR